MGVISSSNENICAVHRAGHLAVVPARVQYGSIVVFVCHHGSGANDIEPVPGAAISAKVCAGLKAG